MELTWYGTAALMLEEGETAIAFDPFGGIELGGMKHPPEKLPYEEAFRKAGAVFVTHGHFDHILHLPQLYGGGETAVYCTAAPRDTLLRHRFPSEQLREIAPGWSGRFGALTVQAYQGRHCRFDAPLVAKTVFSRPTLAHPGHALRLLQTDLAYPEKGETLFYEISSPEARLQIMGSMALDNQTDYPTGADALVLPLQGRSDQDVYALDLVDRLEPRQVILDHWDNSFPPMTGEIDVSGFVRNVEQAFGIPCRPLKMGEKVTFNAMEGTT